MAIASFLLAPNHPTYKEAHRLPEEENYAIPYYVFFMRHYLQQLGFEVRIAVSASGTERDAILPHVGIFPFDNTSKGKTKGLHSLRQWMCRAAEEEKHKAFIMFPEGHFNGVNNFGTMHGGALLLARDAGIPFVPARLDGFDGSAEPLSQVSLTLGEPFMIEHSTRITRTLREEIRQRCYAQDLGLNLVDGRLLPQ